MSSFWNRVTGGEKQPQTFPFEPSVEPSAPVPAPPAPAASVRPKPAWGIAQANQLMSAVVGTMGEEDLVLRVIRKTLESVGVHVGELIAEAKGREADLSTQIEKRQGTIAELERQIAAERAAITGLESEQTLTRRTREGLERSSAAAATRPLPPNRAARDSDRPTVMAVPPGIGETVLGDGDIESFPPDEPRKP